MIFLTKSNGFPLDAKILNKDVNRPQTVPDILWTLVLPCGAGFGYTYGRISSAVGLNLEV